MIINFVYKIIIGFFVVMNLISPPALVSEVAMKQTAPHDYKAMTYNIHRGTTKEGIPSIDQISNIIKKENPDFVALQEVDRYNPRSGFVDEIIKLSNNLHMHQVFGPNIKYGIAEYGNGILSKYPILDSGQIKLAFETEPRSLLWAKVQTDDGIIYITSIHLGLDKIKRDEHFAIIEKFVNSLDKPVVVMGDFNTLSSHPLFQQLETKISGKVIFQETPTFINTRPVQIDYIFGKEIKETKLYNIPSFASDHYPLVATFRIVHYPYGERMVT